MEIGILEKRRAQAEVIKPIYENLKERFGVEVAQSVIGDAVKQAAIEEGRRFASLEHVVPDLSRFSALIPLWQKDDALKIFELKKTAAEYAFNVTRCRYAEMYKEMGLEEIGHLLSCNRDAAFSEGYNPRIELTRTQTIMQGASHCDFRYKLVE